MNEKRNVRSETIRIRLTPDEKSLVVKMGTSMQRKTSDAARVVLLNYAHKFAELREKRGAIVH